MASHAPASPDCRAAETTLLVLIDYQIGVMRRLGEVQMQEIGNNVMGLAKSAKALGLPAVLAARAGHGGGSRLIPALRRLFPTRLVKRPADVVNAWQWPGFRDAVRSSGRRKIVMAGVPADTALLRTALDMAEDGYSLDIVLDASGADSTARDRVADRMSRAGLRIDTWYSAAASLLGDWRCDLYGLRSQPARTSGTQTSDHVSHGT